MIALDYIRCSPDENTRYERHKEVRSEVIKILEDANEVGDSVYEAADDIMRLFREDRFKPSAEVK